MNRLLPVRDKLKRKHTQKYANLIGRSFTRARAHTQTLTQLDFVQNHASVDILLISARIYWWTQRFYVVFLFSWFFIIIIIFCLFFIVIHRCRLLLFLSRIQVHHVNKTRNKMVAVYTHYKIQMSVQKREREWMIICVTLYLVRPITISLWFKRQCLLFNQIIIISLQVNL